WGHGAFTKCLLEELPRLSSQGRVTMGTLIDRLQISVPELVATVSPTETQTPVPFFTNTVDLQLASLVSVKPATMKPSKSSESSKPVDRRHQVAAALTEKKPVIEKN